MRKQLRNWVLGLLFATGIALAPTAFARGHVSVGISLPGLSIGWSDCRHCGYGYGWAGNYGYGGYYGGYGGYYMPAYYRPRTYYAPVYYAPAYYGPAYYGAYYDRGPRVIHRTVYVDDYRGDYGHRSRYYDRDGYYRR
ncbi:MAG: hypothetical protein KIS89_11785 [Dokdonella sp.]|nr:hypothetical protein [Dokdonella sp.]